MAKPLKPFAVQVTLYVEDDDEDGALATAQTILTDAGGRDDIPDAGDDYSTFGFALGPVKATPRRG